MRDRSLQRIFHIPLAPRTLAMQQHPFRCVILRLVHFTLSHPLLEFSDERTWCGDLQALKSFVWIEWVVLLLTLFFTVKYVITQHTKGRTNVWKVALSRYRPEPEFLHPYIDGQLNHVTSHASSFWEGGTPLSVPLSAGSGRATGMAI